ncbi:MAG TPA: long-chain fatty acid--CoA ligase [Candidatus Obscuribacter sp.]|nr:long-chain fatty acid--CoA ligase [Candidatus Obscuribacter sp.]
MSGSTETLLNRFWSHVFDKADQEAVRVPNPREGERQYIVTATPMGAGGGGAVIVEAPAFLTVEWSDSGAIVAEIMKQLMDLGVRRGDRVAILSWNCAEWVWTDIAIQSLGAVTVPIYPNSAAEQVNFILANCDARLLIGDGVSQTQKVNADSGVQTRLFSELVAGSEHHRVKVLGNKLPEDRDSFDCQSSVGAKSILAQMSTARSAFPFQEATDGKAAVGVKPDDLATIIYTSGSTGVPKGVVLTHGNIAASCTALYGHGFDFGEDDLYLSYLPLAHVYERVNGQFICLWQAVPTVFCKVEEVSKYLKKVRPTIMLGVPAVWRKIKDKMQSEIDGAKGFKAKLLKWAFGTRRGTISGWLANMLVFSKIRGALGGRLRIMGSGGAPISPEVLSFFQSVGMNIIQGYGLTETCGGIAANKPDDIVVGTVGKVIADVEVKLVPEPGSTDGSGVIWLRGGPVSPGYWQLPEENRKSYDAEGWFNTGDLGRFDANGNLAITGRKKRLLKTDGGKYVAPEKVEKAFDGHGIIQAIVPVGDAKPFIGALIFVNPIAAKELLAAKGVSVPAGDNAQSFIVKHPEVVAAVSAAIKDGNTRLEHWETVKKYELIEDEATVANGLLTATLKIRTEEAMKRYEALIEKIYTKPGH